MRSSQTLVKLSPKALENVEQNSSYQALASSTTIAFLPPEILSLIFKFLYMEVRIPAHYCTCHHPPSDLPQQQCNCFAEPYATDWEDSEDLSSTALFPYSVASVCQQWRDIAARIPVFWTRVVVFVDFNPTPISTLRSYLEWSQDLPLQVYVLRRDKSWKESLVPTSDADPTEPSRTRAVIDLLFPHLRRFELLTFDVIYSSSLPSMTRDFHGPAPLLQMLKLECKLYNGSCLDDVPIATEAREPFSSPNVIDLALDGDTLLEAIDIPGWTQDFCSQSRSFISFSHIPPSNESNFDLISLLEMLSVIPRLGSLSLQDVNLGCRDDEEQAGVPNNVMSIDLKNLTNDFLREFFSVAQFNGAMRAHISHCDIAGVDFPHIPVLVLSEIDSSTDDLIRFLTPWCGNSLKFENCGAFNDQLLQWLGSSDDLGLLNVYELSALQIVNCPDFSIPVLRKMVESRNEAALKGGEEISYFFLEIPRMHYIACEGSAPVLSPEDAKWFESNVMREFTWQVEDDDEDT